MNAFCCVFLLAGQACLTMPMAHFGTQVNLCLTLRRYFCACYAVQSLPVSVSVCLSVLFSVCVCHCVCLSLSLSVSLSLSLSVWLSVSVSVYLSPFSLSLSHPRPLPQHLPPPPLSKRINARGLKLNNTRVHSVLQPLFVISLACLVRHRHNTAYCVLRPVSIL